MPVKKQQPFYIGVRPLSDFWLLRINGAWTLSFIINVVEKVKLHYTRKNEISNYNYRKNRIKYINSFIPTVLVCSYIICSDLILLHVLLWSPRSGKRMEDTDGLPYTIIIQYTRIKVSFFFMRNTWGQVLESWDKSSVKRV